jgi:hypothetical protein
VSFYPRENLHYRLDRLAYQPPASSTFLSEQISHQQSTSGTFFSEQTSTSHQPPAKRTGFMFPIGMASSECSFTQVYKFGQEAIKGHRIIFGTTSSDQENASTNVES